MVIISNFKLFFKDNIYKVNSYEIVSCPNCGGKLYCIGSKKRKLIREDGCRVILSIRYLRCTKCGKIHAELPDIVIPYHLYCYAIIEKVYLGHRNLTPIDDGTFRRLYFWLKSIEKYTNPIVSIQFIKKLHNQLAYQELNTDNKLSPSTKS